MDNLSSCSSTFDKAKLQMNLTDTSSSDLRNIIKLNNQELETLQYMVSFKDQALKKRDELIKDYLEENQELKAQLKKQEQMLLRLKKNQEG